MLKISKILLTSGLLVFGFTITWLVQAEVQRSSNEENGLQKWHFIGGDIEIELVQRLPDQTRAMFMKHEFSSEVVEFMATSCMFQTIIRNSGKSGSGQSVDTVAQSSAGSGLAGLFGLVLGYLLGRRRR